jgi:hypothetical protein
MVKGRKHRTDVSQTPELLRLAEEVQRTKQPRVLVKASEELAVVIPIAPRMKGSTRPARSTPPQPALTPAPARYTLESVMGSVEPRTRTEDFEAISQEAKEAHLARSRAKLQSPQCSIWMPTSSCATSSNPKHRWMSRSSSPARHCSNASKPPKSGASPAKRF